MRGGDFGSGSLFSYVDIEARIPASHPLRLMRELVNASLLSLDGDFSKLYSRIGRPSIAPERLLRAMLLQMLYSIRSERQLVERLEYDISLPTKAPKARHSDFPEAEISTSASITISPSINAQGDERGCSPETFKPSVRQRIKGGVCGNERSAGDNRRCSDDPVKRISVVPIKLCCKKSNVCRHGRQFNTLLVCNTGKIAQKWRHFRPFANPDFLTHLKEADAAYG